MVYIIIVIESSPKCPRKPHYTLLASILALTGKLKTAMLSWSLRGRTMIELFGKGCCQNRKHGKCYENLYVWSDGMGTQFRSRFAFKLLAGTVLPKSLVLL